MILGFKTKFPDGSETYFREKILQSVGWSIMDNGALIKGEIEIPLHQRKIHTIREGQRWKAGMKMHMATGVRTKQYCQFNKGIDELSTVKHVQRIDIAHRGHGNVIISIDTKIKFSRSSSFNKEEQIWTVKELNGSWFSDFLQNDGFENEEQFFQWFKKPLRNGQLIHWTDLKY